MYSLSPQVVKAGCTLLDLIRHRKAVGLLDVDPDQYCRDIVAGVKKGVSSHIVHATDGRLIQAVIVLVWAAATLEIAWTPAKAALLAGATLGGACLFYGLFVLGGTLAFWTVEGLEIMNAFTYGGTETAQFPLPIYRPWFRAFFTYVIPLACANYLPAQAILGRGGDPALWQWLSPVVGLLFLLVCFQVWNVGVRHYCSTGS